MVIQWQEELSWNGNQERDLASAIYWHFTLLERWLLALEFNEYEKNN